MSTEADFAMQYAEERKLRIQLESRLSALAAESASLHGQVDDLINCCLKFEIAASNPAFIAAITKTIDYNSDVEVLASLNFFNPLPDGMPINCIDELNSARNYKPTFDRYKQDVEKISDAAIKRSRDEWDEFASDAGLKTHQQIREYNRSKLVTKHPEFFIKVMINEGFEVPKELLKLVDAGSDSTM